MFFIEIRLDLTNIEEPNAALLMRCPPGRWLRVLRPVHRLKLQLQPGPRRATGVRWSDSNIQMSNTKYHNPSLNSLLFQCHQRVNRSSHKLTIKLDFAILVANEKHKRQVLSLNSFTDGCELLLRYGTLQFSLLHHHHPIISSSPSHSLTPHALHTPHC